MKISSLFEQLRDLFKAQLIRVVQKSILGLAYSSSLEIYSRPSLFEQFRDLFQAQFIRVVQRSILGENYCYLGKMLGLKCTRANIYISEMFKSSHFKIFLKITGLPFSKRLSSIHLNSTHVLSQTLPFPKYLKICLKKRNC